MAQAARAPLIHKATAFFGGQLCAALWVVPPSVATPCAIQTVVFSCRRASIALRRAMARAQRFSRQVSYPPTITASQSRSLSESFLLTVSLQSFKKFKKFKINQKPFKSIHIRPNSFNSFKSLPKKKHKVVHSARGFLLTTITPDIFCALACRCSITRPRRTSFQARAGRKGWATIPTRFRLGPGFCGIFLDPMQTKWMGTISRMESRSQKKAAVQECYSQIHLLFIFFAVDRRGAYARPTQPFGATLGCASSPGNHFLKHTALTCASFLVKPSPLPQSLLSFMNSSTSSNKIEPPIDIFNRFLFLSLLGCQHLSLSRAEADVAVSGCVEKLFEKNLFHASIVPHVFALMQNKALLSQWISQSLSSVDSFLAATDLSWNAGLWADSHFYGRPPPR